MGSGHTRRPVVRLNRFCLCALCMHVYTFFFSIIGICHCAGRHAAALNSRHSSRNSSPAHANVCFVVGIHVIISARHKRSQSTSQKGSRNLRRQSKSSAAVASAVSMRTRKIIEALALHLICLRLCF
jgi:hypothetical protein